MISRREVLLGSGAAALWFERKAGAAQREPSMHRAAAEFLASLTPDQRATAHLPFSSEERLNWHYVPMERRGLRYDANHIHTVWRDFGLDLLALHYHTADHGHDV